MSVLNTQDVENVVDPRRLVIRYIIFDGRVGTGDFHGLPMTTPPTPSLRNDQFNINNLHFVISTQILRSYKDVRFYFETR